MTALALRPLRLPGSTPLVAGLVASALLGLMIVEQPLLAFAAVFGLALAVAILAFPDLATFAVVFLIYTNAAAVAVKYHDVPYTAGILIPGLVVVPVAFHLFRRRPVVVDSATLAVVVFLVVQVVSTLLADHKGHAFDEMTAFVIEGVAIYLLVRNAIRTVNVLRLVVWTMLLAGVFMAAVIIFQEVTASYSRPFLGFGQVGHEWFIGRARNPRLSGPIGDPNYFAQILLVLVPLGLLRFFGERTMFLRLLAAGATGVIAFALTLTFSRGAGVAFVVVLVMMTVFRYIPLYQLLIVVLGLVLLLSFVPAYKERVATLGSLAGGSSETSQSLDQSFRSRTTEMRAAAQVFLDHPVVGVGPGSFPLYYQDYATRVGLDVHEAAESGARRGEEARRESHNIFLSIAADLGIVGLVSFLAILFLTFRRLNRSRKGWVRAHPEAANLAASFMLGLAAYLTSGLFLTLAFERYFWLLLALAGSAAALDVGEEAVEPAVERDAARPVRRAPARRARPTAPPRRTRLERRPPRHVRRPEPVTIDVPLPEQPPPIEVTEEPLPAPPPAVLTPPAPLVPATVVIDVAVEEAEAGVTKLVEVPHVETCPACAGTKSAGADLCAACDGIGRLVTWTTIGVEIPRDVKDGERIALSAPDGEAGNADLGYALLCVESDPNDKIIRTVAYAELASALAFIGYLYFVA